MTSHLENVNLLQCESLIEVELVICNGQKLTVELQWTWT